MPKLKVIKKLGQGSYGAAFLVMDTKTNDYFVMKEIDVSEMPEAEVQDCKKEVQILALLKHSNITAYKRSFVKKGYLVIVMEYADGGDLNQLIRKRRKMKKYFSENQVLDWFSQVAMALKHIHEQHILHRDLKTQNVFLTSNGLVKLGDFGISRVLDNTMAQANTMVGTPYYLSPEIVSNKPYGRKSDTWALGVVLYEMLTLKVPFTAESLPELAEKILKGEYAPIPKHYSDEIRNLVSGLLHVDHASRLSVEQVLQTPSVAERVERYTALFASESRAAEEPDMAEGDNVEYENENPALEPMSSGKFSKQQMGAGKTHDDVSESETDDNMQTFNKTLKEITSTRKTGWLTKKSRHVKRWRRRWAVLDDMYLHTFKDPENLDAKPTESIDLRVFHQVLEDNNIKKRTFCFSVRSAKKVFVFEARSAPERRDWMDAIRTAVQVYSQ